MLNESPEINSFKRIGKADNPGHDPLTIAERSDSINRVIKCYRKTACSTRTSTANRICASCRIGFASRWIRLPELGVVEAMFPSDEQV